MTGKWALLAVAGLTFAVSALAGQASPREVNHARNGRVPRVNYMTECQGCHLPDGSGMAGKVPSMKGEIARFLEVEGGRRFIIQVPGAANSKLSDADLADVMNWIVTTMGRPEPGRFQPYTADEVAAYRSVRMTDVARTRAQLVRQFVQVPAPQTVSR
ncbi:MAG TPA: cytochrome C [Sphingobium sp.]|nr:cytochrome C [Sphingobium sp.]